MPPIKKTVPAKLSIKEVDNIPTEVISKEQLSDLMNNYSQKTKKLAKRSVDSTKIEDTGFFSNPTSAKKKKNNESIEAYYEKLREKTMNVMNRQLDARKQVDKQMLKKLSDAIEDLQADYNVLKENEQRMEQLTGAFMKCMLQTTTAYKQKLKLIKELHATYKKRYEDTDVKCRDEINILARELEEDIQKLEQEIVLETKCSDCEKLREKIEGFMKAMQNNF